MCNLVLGATPYVEVKNRDLANRVIRGLRVPQTDYMTDDIYQIMLQCWQLDLDERPTFSQLANELSHLLDDMTARQTFHISFEMTQPRFQYEEYSNDLEFL